MAIRRSQKLNKSRKNRRISSLKAQRRALRGLRIEPLEARQLLAVGPQLVGIQPNEGELLTQDQTRNTAPLELKFLFNSTANIDQNSLPTDESNPQWYDSIQITRSGDDGTFEHASIFSDFNTGGLVTVEFEAVAAGQAGSLVQIQFDKADLGAASRRPAISATGNSILITLNTNVGRTTRAADLIAQVNTDPASSGLITARLRSGSGAIDVTTPIITYSPLNMTPANTATATTNFNATGLQVEFVAAEPGMASNGISVAVTPRTWGWVPHHR